MPIIIGILLVPLVLYIIRETESVKISKEKALKLRVLLALSPVVYSFIFVFVIRLEPFNEPIHYSEEYMLFSGTYLIEALTICVFAPFVWTILIYFTWKTYRMLTIKKNTIIKRDYKFRYYRDNLEQVAPGIILFASELTVDIKRAIGAGILKLKLSGHLEEIRGKYSCTNKSNSQLFESEKMLLHLIETGEFNGKDYREQLEAEAISEKYIVRNKGGILFRLFFLILTICMPFILYNCSVYLDDYSHENYWFEPLPNDEGGYDLQFNFNIYDDIDKLAEERLERDDSDYESYKSASIYQLQYSSVRKAWLISTFALLSLVITITSFYVAIISVFLQIFCLNKNYRRTLKGNELLNKAYGLKNYLTEYSLIENRSAKELRLWQYYMVYAVALDVNETIEEQVIKKIKLTDSML